MISLITLCQEPNPETLFSVCHWNLNSISAHNYSKVSLLKASLTIHTFDIVRLSQRYLDSNTAPDNGNLKFHGII